MSRLILIDEFHLCLLVPRGLRALKCRAVRRALGSARFRARLHQALRAVIDHYAALRPVRLRISQ